MGCELTFIMPTGPDDVTTRDDDVTAPGDDVTARGSTHALTALLEELEKRREELGVDKFGISYTTLEEVKVGWVWVGLGGCCSWGVGVKEGRVRFIPHNAQ